MMTRASKVIRMLYLCCRILIGPSLTGSTDTVVALTSYGLRINTSCLAIESIACGSAKPERLILYLAEAERERRLPFLLRRQVRRGLEVVYVRDDRSYKKIVPYAASKRPHDKPLATADDDVLYPSNWLRDLAAAYARRPDAISGFRARRICLDGGKLAPYSSWLPCDDVEPAFRTFLTGVSGIIYPPRFLDHIQDEGKTFRESAPYADDIWLHSLAVRHGFKHHQITPIGQEFWTIPRTQSNALMTMNVDRGANDLQAGRCYQRTEVSRISSEYHGARGS